MIIEKPLTLGELLEVEPTRHLNRRSLHVRFVDKPTFAKNLAMLESQVLKPRMGHCALIKALGVCGSKPV